MNVAEYGDFVRRTDQTIGRPIDARRSIALYGLVGEIGSLIAAVNKQLLGEAGAESWDQPNEEIVEEIGDVIWYAVALSQIANPKPINILTNDIALLKAELGASSERAKKIHAALDAQRKDEFLKAAEDFPNTKEMTFDHYQKLAFLTARTEGRDLLEVCLAVLAQLGAELLREKLPEIELELNKNVADRHVNVLLGEIAWHLSAVASLMRLSLNTAVDKNVEKVSFRSNRQSPTKLHDEDRKEGERFPRRMEISFISIGPKQSRMYLNGKRLGDDLTDNAYDDDGYRFHDVFHLANVAHLGWSPVLRRLMGRKRKSRDDQVDEVEDGARAAIVEEVVLKAIHSEGVRLARGFGPHDPKTIVQTFPTAAQVSFRFLKTLRTFVDGLEAAKNQYWEWEGAILEGASAYYQLRIAKQGTVTVDMEKRTLSFSPDVAVSLKGALVGLGTGAATRAELAAEEKAVLSETELSTCNKNDDQKLRLIAVKRAVADALGLDPAEQNPLGELKIKLLDERQVCVTATGATRERIWKTGAISYQISSSIGPDGASCTAAALCDAGDI